MVSMEIDICSREKEKVGVGGGGGGKRYKCFKIISVLKDFFFFCHNINSQKGEIFVAISCIKKKMHQMGGTFLCKPPDQVQRLLDKAWFRV